MRSSVGAVAFLVAASLACGGPLQSYSQGMAVICDAPRDCAECRGASPAEVATLLAAHIDGKLWNPSAREVFQGLAMVDPADKARVLRAAATEAGLSSCDLADVFGPP